MKHFFHWSPLKSSRFRDPIKMQKSSPTMWMKRLPLICFWQIRCDWSFPAATLPMQKKTFSTPPRLLFWWQESGSVAWSASRGHWLPLCFSCLFVLIELHPWPSKFGPQRWGIGFLIPSNSIKRTKNEIPQILKSLIFKILQMKLSLLRTVPNPGFRPGAVGLGPKTRYSGFFFQRILVFL